MLKKIVFKTTTLSSSNFFAMYDINMNWVDYDHNKIPRKLSSRKIVLSLLGTDNPSVRGQISLHKKD